jgi:hypothetical protein
MDELKKRVSQLNPGTNFLEKMLGEVPTVRAKSIGYDYKVLNKLQQSQDTKFNPAEEVFDPYTGNMMPQHLMQHSVSYLIPQSMQHPKSHSHARRHKRRPRSWVCHHCGRKGHIRPYCFKLYGYPKWFHQPEHSSEVQSAKKEWKPKSEEIGLIAHTSLRVPSREDWYFDSGCSRHMTGVGKFLKDVKSYKTSFVTFGDGAKGEIVGIGNLINNDLPNLENVLLVKGLTTNLISISQLCDQGLKVNFTEFECLVIDDTGKVLMKGARSKDNYYLWVPQESVNPSTCLSSKEEEAKL